MASINRRRDAGAILAAIATILFVVALAMPVATARQTQGLTTIMGYEVLFVGPMGVLNGQFGWIATPCLIVAILSAWVARWRLGTRGGMVLVVVMGLALVDALFWRDYPNDGGPGPLVSHGPGYGLWMAAVVLGAASVIVGAYRDRQAGA